MKTTKGYRIGIVDGWQIQRISPSDLTLKEAQQGMQTYNNLLHGTRSHAIIVQPISEAIVKATPKSKIG